MELIIKQDFFNPLFINFNIPNNKKPTFFNIIYKSPTIELDGIFLETPWMECYLPPSKYDVSDDNKYHMELSFNGYKFNSGLRLFYSSLSGIDRRVTNFLYNNKKLLNLMNSIDNYYHKQVRFIKGNNGVTDSIIRLKLFKNATKTVLSGNSNVENKDIGFLNTIKKGDRVKAYIKCNGIWYYNGKFGLSWKAYRLVIDSENVFNNSSSENEEQLTFMLDEDKDFNNNVVKSSDEEKSDEEEGKEDENNNHGNIFGRELNIDFAKSPLDIPNSVGSIAEENVCILSKFS